VLEGESVQLPIALRHEQTKLERKWLSLTFWQNGILIEDWFDKVQLHRSGDEKTGYNYLEVCDLL
jgi:hypothetical protein